MDLMFMVHKGKYYRLRGVYLPTGKDSWVTTVWRRTKEEAESDRCFINKNYENVRVIETEKPLRSRMVS